MKGRKPGSIAVSADALTKTPLCPRWLGAHARDEWRRVAPVLTMRGVLTQSDLAALEAYCVSAGRIREIEEMLQTDGFSIPLVRQQDKAMATARQLGVELGLTPVSRSKAALAGGDDGPAYLE